MSAATQNGTPDEELQGLKKNSTFKDVDSWLQSTQAISRTVARIDFQSNDSASGFLLPDKWLLTCLHAMVVEDERKAIGCLVKQNNTRDAVTRLRVAIIDRMTKAAGAIFNFRRLVGGKLDKNSVTVNFSPFSELPFITAADLPIDEEGRIEPQADWVMLKLDQDFYLEETAPIHLTKNTTVRLDEEVHIVHHPGTLPKQLTTGKVSRPGNPLNYKADTMEGSSGAPVFNNAGHVVAIHRASTNTQALGNEAVAIDSVIDEMEAQGYDPFQKVTVTDMHRLKRWSRIVFWTGIAMLLWQLTALATVSRKDTWNLFLYGTAYPSEIILISLIVGAQVLGMLHILMHRFQRLYRRSRAAPFFPATDPHDSRKLLPWRIAAFVLLVIVPSAIQIFWVGRLFDASHLRIEYKGGSRENPIRYSGFDMLKVPPPPPNASTDEVFDDNWAWRYWFDAEAYLRKPGVDRAKSQGVADTFTSMQVWPVFKAWPLFIQAWAFLLEGTIFAISTLVLIGRAIKHSLRW